jgi:hypothetical protein
MSSSKIVEFHKPFIKSLIFLGLVTIVSMISTKYIVEYIINHHYQSHQYTSSESQK